MSCPLPFAGSRVRDTRVYAATGKAYAKRFPAFSLWRVCRRQRHSPCLLACLSVVCVHVNSATVMMKANVLSLFKPVS
jgi:hypothetical protein